MRDGFPQGYENRMARLASVAGIKLLLPAVEKLEGTIGIAGLVPQIVRPAAVGIDGIEIGSQPGWKQQGRDVKIFIVCLCQFLTVAA